MNTIRITTTQNIELEYDLASLGERILAHLLDLLVVGAYCIIIALSFNFASNHLHNLSVIIFLLFIPVAFYKLACEVWLNGQSVGKKVMKIKVISLDGARPTLGQYIIRWLFRLIDITFTYCLCALISVAVSEKKQRVGDIVAGTTLIRTQPRTTFQHTLYAPVVEANYQVTFPQVASLSDKDLQLIREAALQVQRSNNLYLAYRVAEKVKHLLKIESNLEPSVFLQVVVSDYNYLTSQES